MKRFFHLVIAFLLVLTVLVSLPPHGAAWAIGGDESRGGIRSSHSSPGADLKDKLRADAQVARNVGDDDWAARLDNVANHVNERNTSSEEAFDIAERANTGHDREATDLADRASKE